MTHHPNGLANSSDVVGRHYMRHNNLALMAVSKEPNPTRVPEDPGAARLVPRARTTGTIPLGGIQMLGKSDAEQIRANAPRWAGKVSPGMPFEVLAHHAVDFWLCGEDLPLPDSRVTLENDGAHPPDPGRRTTTWKASSGSGTSWRACWARLGMERAAPAGSQHLPAQGDADRRHRPPGRHGAVRRRSRAARRST